MKVSGPREMSLTEIASLHPGSYDDILGRFGNRPCVVDDDGVYRFKSDLVCRTLLDLVDLNELWRRVGGMFNDDDNPELVDSMARFYMGLGYSLCGFGEIFSEVLDAYTKAREESD